jgi:hypothetical protein
MWSNRELNWKGEQLYRDGSSKPVLSIEPDLVHSGVWRVKRPDSSLTDMVNKTRARDAVRSIALGFLNASLRGRETASEAPPMRSNSPQAQN